MPVTDDTPFSPDEASMSVKVVPRTRGIRGVTDYLAEALLAYIRENKELRDEIANLKQIIEDMK